MSIEKLAPLSGTDEKKCLQQQLDFDAQSKLVVQQQEADATSKERADQKEKDEMALAAVLTSRIFFKPDGKIDHELVKKSGGFVPTKSDVFVPQGEVERAMSAIGSVESGGNVTGKVRYGAIGPLCAKHVTGKFTSKVDGHALGAFQVMAENVGAWAKEAGLSGVTPEQFLADPELQKKIVRHQVEKHLAHGYGLKDIASIWHSGRTLERARASGAGDGINSTVHYADMVAGHYSKLGNGTILASNAAVPENGNKPHHGALKTGEVKSGQVVVVADAKKSATNDKHFSVPLVG